MRLPDESLALYLKAREVQSARWSGDTRDRSHIKTVTLNPERDDFAQERLGTIHTQAKAHDSGANLLDARRMDAPTCGGIEVPQWSYLEATERRGVTEVTVVGLVLVCNSGLYGVGVRNSTFTFRSAFSSRS